MKTKVIIFLEDLYNSNIEPKIKEDVYEFINETSLEKVSKAIGSYINVSSSINIRKRGKYYGNPTKDLKSKYNSLSKDVNNKQYYNKLFYASKKKV